MTFFRNPEVKLSLILHLAVTIVFTAAASFMGLSILPKSSENPRVDFLLPFLSFGLCVSFTAVHMFSTYLRYRRIQQLCLNIDRVLHGADTLHFSDYSEGELAILKIEIDKMLIRLREQSERLKEDTQYLASSLADISHQIRTPLTSIHLVLSLLSEPGLSDAKRHSLVRQLSILISRIDWLIEALLKMSRLDTGAVALNTEHMFVKNLITAAVTPLEISMELREQQFSFSAKTGEEAIWGDFAWTTEAISNLLKNCMEHTPPGGEIRVFTGENAMFTEIIIEDNGPGFAREDLPRLFERFYKGKNSGEESIGIGLSLSRTILSRENATIKAENQPKGGARFVLHFYKRSDFT